jgi:hypothetical protein
MCGDDAASRSAPSRKPTALGAVLSRLLNAVRVLGALVAASGGLWGCVATYEPGRDKAFPGKVLYSYRGTSDVYSGTLADDTIIQGITFKEQTVVAFHDNGKVHSGSLAANTTIQGITYQGNSEVYFDESGRVTSGHLAADSTIQGVRYLAGLVEFDSHGRVNKGVLAADTTLDGISYETGTKVNLDATGRPVLDLPAEPVCAEYYDEHDDSAPRIVMRTYHGGGEPEVVSLPLCKRSVPKRSRGLAVKTAIPGGSYQPGTQLLLDDHDRLKWAMLFADTTIYGVRYKAFTRLTFFENNDDARVEYAKLAADTTIRGVTYKTGASVCESLRFHQNGTVKEGCLAADTVIQGVTYLGSSPIKFRDNGRVWAGDLATSPTIQGVTYSRGSTLYLSPDGRVIGGTLGGDATISGVTHKAGETIRFNEDGTASAVQLFRSRM